MKSDEYKKVVLNDYPDSASLFEAGLISERNVEIYCIQKRFKEIIHECDSRNEACYRLAEEFPKGEKTIYNYIRSIVI